LVGGVLSIKEGPVNAQFSQVATGVSAFGISGDRVAVLQGNTLSIKEGGLDGAWTQVAQGVSSFDLDGDRVGVLIGSTFKVKVGPLNAQWEDIAQGVSSFDLAGDRIGILIGSTFKVKAGPTNAQWTDMAQGVAAFDLAGDRVAALLGTTLKVKAGPLDAVWTDVAQPVCSFALAPPAITSPTSLGDNIANYAETFPNGYAGGQCRVFVNNVMAHFGFNTGGGAPNDYFVGFERHNPTRITDANGLARGDVVQYRKSEFSAGLHTFIILSRVSGTTYNVIDSNWALNELVSRHTINVVLDDDHRAYRFS
jgi:hypothetical protein